MKTREEILHSFKYPVFRKHRDPSGCQRTLFRLKSFDERRIISHSGESFDVAGGCYLHFGDHQDLWGKVFREWLCLQDWVALYLNTESQVERVEVVAPNKTKSLLPHTAATKTLASLETAKTLAERKKIFREFSQFKKWIHEFFEEKGFLEVQTPTLVESPGTEAHLDFFETEFSMGQKRKKQYLPPSPELSLKKLLAQGLGSLYELKLCFRNGEQSPIHRSEFWMLEWYREGGTLQDIRQDCVDLIQFLIERARASGRDYQNPSGVELSTWREQFQKVLGLELHPELELEKFIQACKKLGLYIPEGSAPDDLFNLLVIEKMEPSFDPDRLTFVGDYPPSQAALARISEEGWAERFEIFWKGFELANAYQELNDPLIQRQRALIENETRVQNGKLPVPLDEDFFLALEAGMPPSAGVALGVERLFLALTGLNSLMDIQGF